MKTEWTRFTNFFASKRAARFGVFFIVVGTSLLLPAEAEGVQTGPVKVICANAQGDQREFFPSWDNSNPFFDGKGQISRLFCEGGYAGVYTTFVSNNLSDQSLDYYNGIAPVIVDPIPAPVETPTVVDTPTAPSILDSPTVTEPTAPVNPDTPTEVVSDTPTAVVDSPTATIPDQDSAPIGSPVQEPITTPQPVAEPTPSPTPPVPVASEPAPVPVEPVVTEPEPTQPDSLPIENAPELVEPTVPEPTPVPPVEPEPVVPAPESVDEPISVEQELQTPAPEPVNTQQNPLTDSAAPITTELPSPAPVSILDVDVATLAPETPVELENGVILTAEVVVALQLLENPAELLGAIFTNPGAALMALGNIGADMSPEVREKSEKVVISAIIAGGIATQAAGIAAASTYRRNP